MDDRDRTTPIALARDTPVAQTIVHLPLGRRRTVKRRGLELARHQILGRLHVHAVEESRIEVLAIVGVGNVAHGESRGIGALGQHHRGDGETIFASEIEVALIVRRAAEDGAGAVVHQHEVGDVDRIALAVEGVLHRKAGGKALLLGRLKRCSRGADASALFAEGRHRRILVGQRLGHRMIGGKRQEAHAEQRIRTRGEHLDGRLTGHRRPVDFEANPQALRPADQFFCMVRTFSGQRSSVSRAESNSSE